MLLISFLKYTCMCTMDGTPLIITRPHFSPGCVFFFNGKKLGMFSLSSIICHFGLYDQKNIIMIIVVQTDIYLHVVYNTHGRFNPILCLSHKSFAFGILVLEICVILKSNLCILKTASLINNSLKSSSYCERSHVNRRMLSYSLVINQFYYSEVFSITLTY